MYTICQGQVPNATIGTTTQIIHYNRSCDWLFKFMNLQ